MKPKLRILVWAMVVSLVIGLGCGRDTGRAQTGGASGKGAELSGSIQIKGSDTMVNLGQAWAEAYMKKNPAASVAITGGGSGTGIAALINKTTDIAECSRSIKPAEIEQAGKNGVEPTQFDAARDGITVVVHPSNPISSLSIDRLADIFSGKVTDWKDVGGNAGGIVVLARELNSGTYIYFKERVLNKGNEKGAVEYSRKALMLPSSQAIADEVAQNPLAIGYYGMGYMSSKQKALGVSLAAGSEPVQPTRENVLSGKYPISRLLYFYTNGEPTGAVKDFIDFALSAEGQKIVEAVGFVPVK
jgi:phosphate transport system substrate-binding protein